METVELTYFITQFNQISVMNDLELCIPSMYEAFYYQHKFLHGSFKPLIREKGDQYEKFMEKRFDYIICQLNDTIEGKINYKKKEKQRLGIDLLNEARVEKCLYD